MNKAMCSCKNNADGMEKYEELKFTEFHCHSDPVNTHPALIQPIFTHVATSGQSQH